MLKSRKILAQVLGIVILMAPATGMAEPAADQLIQQMVRDHKNVRECLAKIGPGELKKTLDARRLSLSKGGGREYLVEPASNPEGCGLCGNRRCDKWIYGEAGGRYRLLLYAGGADDVVIMNRTTRGYRDLKVIYPAGGNYPASYEVYTFDGSKYKQQGEAKDIR
jgi:hypothetical protein